MREAALALAAQGRLQAVSVMSGAPDWPAGAAALRALPAASIDVGLHLDLTEHPLPPFAPRGLRRLLWGAYAGVLPRDALRETIRRQLDALEDGLQRAPDYVDGHQHVHQLPGVREPLLDELRRRYGARGPWLRATRAPRAAAAHPDGSTRFKARVIEALGAAGLARLARRDGLRSNAHLLGVYDFRGGAPRYAALLAGWLHAAADGDLLMCHAALPSGTPDGLAAARAAEHAVLASPAFGARLAAEGLRLQPLRRTLATPADGGLR